MSKQSVLGIVKSPDQAHQVLRELKLLGFSADDVSILFPDQGGSRDFVHERQTKAPEGAVTGASAGGLAFGTVGLLVGLGALVIPGFGPLLAVGPLFAALSTGAVGAAVGGITGALVGLGFSEFVAKMYEGKLGDGNTLISVHTENRADIERVKKVFTQHEVEDVGSTAEAPLPEPISTQGLGPIGPF